MQWLQRIFDRILSLLPEVITVEPIEMAARITCGSRYRILSPGWYMVQK